MSELDVGRIVPSTRDLLAALHTRRRSLALVPLLSGDEAAIAAHAQRLDGLDVRAFALEEAGDGLLEAARATRSVPSLSLSPCRSAEDCQRARFHGADGVVLAASDADSWESLRRVAQSMRMLALARAADPEEAARAVGWGARALLLDVADLDTALTGGAPAPMLVVARLPQASAADLQRLSKAVDAAIVPPAVHASEEMVALLETLDG